MVWLSSLRDELEETVGGILLGGQGVEPTRLRAVGSGDTAATADASRRCVVVVDDHRLLAETLVEVLQQLGRPAHAIPPGSLGAVDKAVRTLQPQVALVDYHLGPFGDADDLIRSLVAQGVRVIVFTGDNDRVTAARCIQAGALAVLGKDTTADALLEAIERAEHGRPVMDPGTRIALVTELRDAEMRRRRELAPFQDLTPREQDVLEMMCRGLSAAEMADRSFVSLATVRSQIRAILTKLGVNSQLAAVAMAHRTGWVDRPGSDSSTLAMTGVG